MENASHHDHQNLEDESTISRHRFVTLIVSSIAIALLLVMVSMQLYNTSGAAQLDASGPRYVDIRSAITHDDIRTFESTGPITDQTLEEFESLYDQQSKKVLNQKGFGTNALDDRLIGL